LDDKNDTSKRALIDHVLGIKKEESSEWHGQQQSESIPRPMARESMSQAQSEIERSLSPEERAFLNDYELQLGIALSLSLEEHEKNKE
jgi:hypothetical protein